MIRFASAATFVIALALSACGAPQGGAAAGPGARATDFTLADLDGRTVRLSDYLGKQVVLLSFWATWCGPCAGELPHLQRMYETHRDKGFVILSVAMDGPETAADVVSHARRYGLTFPVMLDQETRVVAQYNPKRDAPFAVLIGRDGTIVKSRQGYSAGDEVALEREVEALLAAAP